MVPKRGAALLATFLSFSAPAAVVDAQPQTGSLLAGEHACGARIGMDYGGNPTYINQSDPLGGTVSCGYAPIVAIVTDHEDWVPPSFFSGAVTVDRRLRNPLQCQALCQAHPDCDYFAYEWKLQGNATHGTMYHECFLKSTFEDELCMADPYVVWTREPNATGWGESGRGMPCATMVETEMACGGMIGMNMGSNPTYTYVNFTEDAGDQQVNETVVVECGFAEVLELIADSSDSPARLSDGTVTIDENMTSPLQCQTACLESAGCEYFSYKWQHSGNDTHGAMHHECEFKAGYDDELCNANPYTPWISEDPQWHGQSGLAVPCASLTELTPACGGQPGMDYGGNPSYSYENFTLDAGHQTNETVVVECGFAPTIAIITDNAAFAVPSWYDTMTNPLLVFPNMTSPIQCQAQCAVTSGCFAFSYEWEYDAGTASMYHECFLKEGPYDDPQCAAAPYVPWDSEDAMWHGQSGPPMCGAIEVELTTFSVDDALQAADDVMNAFADAQEMLTVPTANIGSAIVFPIGITEISCASDTLDVGSTADGLLGRRQLQFGDLGLEIDIPCPPRIIFEKVFISMMSSGLGGFPPTKIFIDTITEPIFCTDVDGVAVAGQCAEGDDVGVEGPLACAAGIIPCQSGGGVEVTFHLVVPEPIAELAGSLLNTLAAGASELLAIGAAQAGPMAIPSVMQGPPMSLALAPPPPPPQMCDTDNTCATSGTRCCTNGALLDGAASCVLDECNAYDFGDASSVCCALPAACTTDTTTTCAAGAVRDPTGTCAAPSCSQTDFGNQNSNCCTVPAACGTDITRSCNPGAVRDDSGTCAAAACADSDFGSATANCCSQAAPCSTITQAWINQLHGDQHAQWMCQAPAVNRNEASCAGASCTPADFGDGATRCCSTPCSVDTTRTCSGDAVRDPDGFCNFAECTDSDFGASYTRCCATAALCPSDRTRSCTSGSIDDSSGTCSGPVCTDADFGTASTNCCKPAPPVNVVLSLAIDIESIPPASEERRTFQSNFKTDVGNRLGVGRAFSSISSPLSEPTRVIDRNVSLSDSVWCTQVIALPSRQSMRDPSMFDSGSSPTRMVGRSPSRPYSTTSTAQASALPAVLRQLLSPPNTWPRLTPRPRRHPRLHPRGHPGRRHRGR